MLSFTRTPLSKLARQTTSTFTNASVAKAQIHTLNLLSFYNTLHTPAPNTPELSLQSLRFTGYVATNRTQQEFPDQARPRLVRDVSVSVQTKMKIVQPNEAVKMEQRKIVEMMREKKVFERKEREEKKKRGVRKEDKIPINVFLGNGIMLNMFEGAMARPGGAGFEEESVRVEE